MGSIVADAVGGTQAYTAQQNNARFQAGVAEQNAAISSAQSDQAQRVGATQAGLAKTKGSLLAGAQKADYAASGVVAGSGTASTVQLDTKAMSDLDASTIKNNATRQAWGYQVQKNQYSQQAGLDIYGGLVQGQATILKTGTKVASDTESMAMSAYGGMK